jgi:long-chain fatty acid transport protein
MFKSFTTKSRHLLLASAISMSISMPITVHATNGYAMHGYGTAQKAMAGAGSALPMDSFIVYSNPAGLTKLGKQLDFEVSVFNPNRKYIANNDFTIPSSPFEPGFVNPGEYQSGSDWFLMSSLGMNWRLDNRSALALTMVASGGMNTEYSSPVFGNFTAPAGTPPIPADYFFPGSPPLAGNENGQYTPGSKTGINLQQLLIALSYAWEANKNHSLAISPIFAIQSIKVTGLQPFTQPQFTVDPNKVTNNGTDISYGGGLRIGWLGMFMQDRLSLGLSYQSKLWMTKFDDYQGLFADGGNFDIPAQLNVGIAYKVNPKLSLAADWQRIFYSDINSVNNTNASFDFTDPEARLGGRNSLGFGWNSINVIKFGANYTIDNKWSVRAGFSHSDPTFDGVEALFNILAPATVENHASFGFTYQLNKNSALGFAYTHVLNKKVDGQNPQFTGTQTGSVEMNQNLLDFSWNYRY